MSHEPNAHIFGYLNYYLDLPYPPQFGVMLDGLWGTGKTFAIKKFLELRFGEDITKYIYVSLFGVSSRKELDEAMLAAAFVSKGVISSISIARLTWMLLDKTKRLVELDSPLDNFQIEVIVFDDLERCQLDVNIVLGYINELVERDQRKVIIVANQAEIEKLSQNKKDDNTTWNAFLLRKEKVVGKTFRVLSNLEDVVEHLIEAISSEEAKAFLFKSTKEIINILRSLDISNIRILQQTIWDFENVFKQVAPPYRNNFDAMNNILRTFFPLSLEQKLGRLEPEHLKKWRTSFAFERINRKDEGPIAHIVSKYPDMPTIEFRVI